MKKVIIIFIILIIIAIAACVILNNKNNHVIENEFSGEIVDISDSGEMIATNLSLSGESDNSISSENLLKKLEHLKEEIQNTFVNDSYVVVPKEEANKLYEFESATNAFVLQNDNNNEICVVQLDDNQDADALLFKVIKRYDSLSEDDKLLHDITIKQRGKLIFLILSNNVDEVEDVIEKEYLDK